MCPRSFVKCNPDDSIHNGGTAIVEIAMYAEAGHLHVPMLLEVALAIMPLIGILSASTMSKCRATCSLQTRSASALAT